MDLSDHEFATFYLNPFMNVRNPTLGKYAVREQNNFDGGQNFLYGRFLQELIPLQGFPRKINWKTQGKITEVKQQGSCNACYAFSANAALEAHLKIKYGSQMILSEQEIIDCSSENYACKGGIPSIVLDYVIENELS